MLPPLSGLRVVDLGCGYGWFCRWARDRGAAQVEGLDLSSRMLERAREMTRGEGIRYRCENLENLTLPANSCELVYSSLALHYLPDVAPLVRYRLPGADARRYAAVLRRASHLYRPAAAELAGR